MDVMQLENIVAHTIKFVKTENVDTRELNVDGKVVQNINV
jgi:hypothetical protein